jgi:hypothetical protein
MIYFIKSTKWVSEVVGDVVAHLGKLQFQSKRESNLWVKVMVQGSKYSIHRIFKLTAQRVERYVSQRKWKLNGESGSSKEKAVAQERK